MAVLVRYFGTSTNGNGNCLSWANRGALVTAGVWNPIITAQNYTSNSIVAMIEPGSYSIGLLSFSSVSPNTLGRLSFISAPGGTRWVPTNQSWNCCQPMWNSTNMVEFNTSTSGAINNLFINCWGIKLFGDGNNAPYQSFTAHWCYFKQARTGNSVHAAYLCNLINCVAECTGTSFISCVYVTGNKILSNVRIIGNPLANSGIRAGWYGTSPRMDGICIIGFLEGVLSSNSASNNSLLDRLTIIGLDTPSSIGVRSRAGATNPQILSNSVIHNIVTGVSNTDTAKTTQVENCLFNSVTSIHNGNNEWDNIGQNYINTLSNSDLFVDAANNDYRIKYGSPYWGKAVGAGDGPALSTSYGFIY